MKSSADLNIVLVEPEIPQNTGNVGRTCLGLGATLHLVGKLGFSLDEKNLRRAGLDYWPNVSVVQHASWEEFLSSLPAEHNMCFFSTKGTTSLWDISFRKPSYLVFGSESRGFPPPFYEKFRDRLVRIPIKDSIRSLNLATAVGVVSFHAARQLNLC